MSASSSTSAVSASSSSVFRVGILGTGWIASAILQHLYTSDGQPRLPHVHIVAVASRSLDKAEQFISNHSPIPSSSPLALKPYSSYSSLLSDPSIDAVYLALPTTVRLPLVLEALSNKKSVLIEKPFLSSSEANEIKKACQEADVFGMDATHWVHHPRTEEIKRIVARSRESAGLAGSFNVPRPLSSTIIDSFRIGKLKQINAAFTFPNFDAAHGQGIRGDHSLEPHGSLGDLGWYCLSALSRFLPLNDRLLFSTGFAYHPPLSFAASSSSSSLSFHNAAGTGSLVFESGVRVNIDYGFDATLRQWFELVGVEGSIYVDDFVLPWYGSEAFARNKEVKQDDKKWEYQMRPGIPNEMSVFTRKGTDSSLPIQVFEPYQDPASHDNILNMFRCLAYYGNKNNKDVNEEKRKEAVEKWLGNTEKCMKWLEALKENTKFVGEVTIR